MEKFIKDNWKFLLIILLGGLIGGYCTGLYLYDSISEEVLLQLQEQNITKTTYSLIAMFQYGIIYGLVLAIIGIYVSEKVNLWKKFKYNKKAIVATTIITLIAAFILYPGDKLIFGPFNSFVKEAYSVSPSVPKIISGLLVGGIIEEVMLRLFFMSLIALIIKTLFYRNEKNIPVKVYIISNIIAALLFAAGHIPSTMAMTTITPILIIRCFLFNGGIGLCLGYLYRKYGIGYAMISHGLTHIISDILMVIFI